ncbi:MAG: hypothetical protein ACNA8L_11805 [Luteolibacter sp.]|jgi:spermidine synthase
MKPRITLAEVGLPDGNILTLQSHDGRIAILSHGEQVCGPATRAGEEELGRLACAPFRPVRQPKIWIAGAGLGAIATTVTQELGQKRGTFIVAEPVPAILDWHRDHLPDSPLLKDERFIIESDAGVGGLHAHTGSLHAIIVHLDASPDGSDGRRLPENPRWLAAAYEALIDGGLLAVGGTRPLLGLFRKLRRQGFDVAEHSVPSSPLAKKPRMIPILLARKGRYQG